MEMDLIGCLIAGGLICMSRAGACPLCTSTRRWGISHNEVTDTNGCRFSTQTVIRLTCSGHSDRANDRVANHKRFAATEQRHT